MAGAAAGVAAGSAGAAGSGAAAAGTSAAVAGGLGIFGNIIAGEYNKRANREAREANERLQKEFAQNSIQWRMADAKKAGINPYYALGASGMSYTPFTDTLPEDSFGQGVANLGEITRDTILAYQSQKLQNKLLQTEIQGKQIDNIIRLQQVDQNAGLFNFAPNADRNGRQYIGFTDRGKALEELFSEADGWYGTLRNLKLASAMFDNAKVEAKNRGMHAGFDTKTGYAYLTSNAKDLGIPPVLTNVEIQKFEAVAKRLITQGASASEVVLDIIGLLEKIGSKIPTGFLSSFLK